MLSDDVHKQLFWTNVWEKKMKLSERVEENYDEEYCGSGQSLGFASHKLIAEIQALEEKAEEADNLAKRLNYIDVCNANKELMDFVKNEMLASHPILVAKCKQLEDELEKNKKRFAWAEDTVQKKVMAANELIEKAAKYDELDSHLQLRSDRSDTRELLDVLLTKANNWDMLERLPEYAILERQINNQWCLYNGRAEFMDDVQETPYCNTPAEALRKYWESKK